MIRYADWAAWLSMSRRLSALAFCLSCGATMAISTMLGSHVSTKESVHAKTKLPYLPESILHHSYSPEIVRCRSNSAPQSSIEQGKIGTPPSELSMTGRPAEALLKDTRGSSEGTRRISRVVPRQTRQTSRSPPESGFRVLLTSVCKLQAEILEVFAARRPAVPECTVRTPAKPALFRVGSGMHHQQADGAKHCTMPIARH